MGKIEVLFSNPSSVVCCQLNRDPVVNVAPFRMMVAALSDKCHLRHQTKSLLKVAEGEGALQCVVSSSPICVVLEELVDLC